MKEKSRIRKSIIVMLVVAIFASATLIPGVIGKSYSTYNEDEKSAIKNNVSPLKNLENRFGFVRLFQNILSKISLNKPRPLSILSGVVRTNCNGIEESTDIMFWSSKDIDVDKEQGTGVNGKDIRVRYLLAPWIEFGFDIGIGLSFILTIERLGEEIKDSDFSVSFEILDNDISMGYRSRSETGNEIPDYTQVSFTIFFYLFERTRGLEIAINPEYDGGNNGKKIELFGGYNREAPKRRFSIEFDPAIQIKTGFVTTKKQGVWNYKFYRESTQSSMVTSTFTTIENGKEKDVTLTIDEMPKEMSFDLGLTPFTQGGGQFLYESSEMYDIELQISSSELGDCGYSLLRNTPRRIFAEWIPTIYNGEYHLEIDSDGTDFVVKDSLTNPYINLEVNGLENIDIDVYWNLTNPGDIIIYKNTGLNIDFVFKIGNWVAQLNSQPTADFISANWLLDTDGYFMIDTDWKSLTTVDLLIEGPQIGFHTVGETFKAQDFRIDWVLWPPQQWDLDVSGNLSFFSLSIDVFLNGVWYHLWPW